MYRKNQPIQQEEKIFELKKKRIKRKNNEEAVKIKEPRVQTTYCYAYQEQSMKLLRFPREYYLHHHYYFVLFFLFQNYILSLHWMRSGHFALLGHPCFLLKLVECMPLPSFP